jgi:hypothetical protein
MGPQKDGSICVWAAANNKVPYAIQSRICGNVSVPYTCRDRADCGERANLAVLIRRNLMLFQWVRFFESHRSTKFPEIPPEVLAVCSSAEL